MIFLWWNLEHVMIILKQMLCMLVSIILVNCIHFLSLLFEIIVLFVYVLIAVPSNQFLSTFILLNGKCNQYYSQLQYWFSTKQWNINHWCLSSIQCFRFSGILSVQVSRLSNSIVLHQELTPLYRKPALLSQPNSTSTWVGAWLNNG